MLIKPCSCQHPTRPATPPTLHDYSGWRPVGNWCRLCSSSQGLSTRCASTTPLASTSNWHDGSVLVRCSGSVRTITPSLGLIGPRRPSSSGHGLDRSWDRSLTEGESLPFSCTSTANSRACEVRSLRSSAYQGATRRPGRFFHGMQVTPVLHPPFHFQASPHTSIVTLGRCSTLQQSC